MHTVSVTWPSVPDANRLSLPYGGPQGNGRLAAVCKVRGHLRRSDGSTAEATPLPCRTGGLRSQVHGAEQGLGSRLAT
jgi:hypothetical protein